MNLQALPAGIYRRAISRPWLAAVAWGLLLGLGLLVAGGVLLRKSVLDRAVEHQRVIGSGIRDIVRDGNQFMDALLKQATTQCDPENLSRIRLLMLHAQYIRGVGIFNDRGNLYCTTELGRLPHPLATTSPGLPTKRGGFLYINIPLLETHATVHALIYRERSFDVVFDPYAIKRLLKAWHGVVWMRTGGHFDPIEVTETSPRKLSLMKAQIRTDAQGSLIPYHVAGAQVITRVKGTDVALSSLWTPSAIIRAAPLLAALILFAALGIAGLSIIALAAVFTHLNSLDYRIRHLCREDNVRCLYQPVVDLETLEVVGCEVLMRLMDGERVLMPDTVFPRIVRKRLTWTLDRAVMTRAMREMSRHADALAGLKVGFNLYPDDVVFERAGRHLIELKACHGLDRLNLNIEVTEHDFSPEVAAQAGRFREAGFLVSVDDFGTGHSNLAVVRELKPDLLKIDQSFTTGLGMPDGGQSLIPQIVAIAQAVEARVIAEGVERESQIHILRDLGVPYGQGYYFSQPLPIDRFIVYVNEMNRNATVDRGPGTDTTPP